MSKRPYSYTTLRYVHDVVTGEFVNVGLLMFAPATAEAAAAIHFEFKERISRVRGMFPDVKRQDFASAMHALTRRTAAIRNEVCRPDLFVEDTDARSVALKVLPHDGSSLQWSSVGTGIATSIEAAFRRIADRMLSQYDSHNAARKTDEDVWRPVRQALSERKIGIDFEPQVINGEVDSIEFRHSWRNGVIHAYEPLSFDLADANNIKDKARKWGGHLASATIGADLEFRAYFIAGKPTNPSLLPAYQTAIDILRSSPAHPDVFEEGDIDALVNTIEDEFRHHREDDHRYA